MKSGNTALVQNFHRKDGFTDQTDQKDLRNETDQINKKDKK